MPVYRASFCKMVSDDTGHERLVCQRVVRVEAPSPDSALAAAQEQFCALQRISDWRSHADEVVLETVTVTATAVQD